jgi:hypothetical protein
VADATQDEDVTGGVPDAADRATPAEAAASAEAAVPVAPAEAAEPTVPEVPTEDELAATAQDAYVRRAPKIGAFLTVGVLLGALVGLVVALIAGPGSPIRPDGSAFISVLDGQGSVRLIMALSGGVLGALIGAGLAVRADRRSVRGRPEQPAPPRPARAGRRRPRG